MIFLIDNSSGAFGIDQGSYFKTFHSPLYVMGINMSLILEGIKFYSHS